VPQQQSIHAETTCNHDISYTYGEQPTSTTTFTRQARLWQAPKPASGFPRTSPVVVCMLQLAINKTGSCAFRQAEFTLTISQYCTYKINW
jgi:hypothetical protein